MFCHNHVNIPWITLDRSSLTKKIASHCVPDPDDVRVQSERPIQYAFYDSLTYLWKPLVKGIALHLYFIPTATLARSNSSFSVSVAKFERTNSHSAVQVQVQAKTHQVHGLLHNPSVSTNTLQIVMCQAGIVGAWAWKIPSLTLNWGLGLAWAWTGSSPGLHPKRVILKWQVKNINILCANGRQKPQANSR